MLHCIVAQCRNLSVYCDSFVISLAVSVLFVCDTDLTMWKCCMLDIILENNINKTGKTILGGVLTS